MTTDGPLPLEVPAHVARMPAPSMKVRARFVSVLLSLCLTAAYPFAPAHGQSREAIEHLHRAREALSKGSVEKARGELESAHALWPDSPDVAATLGTVLVMLSRYSEALPMLEFAISAHGISAEVNRELGVALYSLGELAAARGNLETSLHLRPVDNRASYYLGLTLYQMQEYAAAIERFAEVTGDYASSARFMRAMSKYHIGEHDRASSAFAELQHDDDTPSALREQARRMRRTISSQQRRWNIAAIARLELDSNVLQTDEHRLSDAVGSSGGDVVHFLLFAPSYRLRSLPETSVRYAFFIRKPWRTEDFDLLGQQLAFAITRSLATNRLEARLRFDHMFLAYQHYLFGSLASFSVERPAGEATRMTLGVQARPKLLAERFATAGAITYGPYISVRRDGTVSIRARYNLHHEHARSADDAVTNSEFSHLGHEGTFAVDLSFANMAVGFEALLAMYDYMHINTIPLDGGDAGEREDRRARLGVTLTWPLDGTARLYATGSYTWNDSNIGFYRYERAIATAGLLLGY